MCIYIYIYRVEFDVNIDAFILTYLQTPMDTYICRHRTCVWRLRASGRRQAKAGVYTGLPTKRTRAGFFYINSV